MKELIEFIAKKLVDHPEDVNVREIEGDDITSYELRVHQDDMGRVIGKDGRTAKAIRTLVGSTAAKKEIRTELNIVE